ncbi:hypothetical protein V6N12_069136 [Hibiscus sabdariffa]|uniref:Retrovirus-related Pol polyprotein from transposon TNT 1-94-like beta-barrel domain-containing protein n=1 Tax=Hibiscus sabdariffa TaxID=183260 RepID=A0ABR2FCY2_9ROSI
MMALKSKEGMSIPDHVNEFQSVMNKILGIITLDLAKSDVLNEEVRRFYNIVRGNDDEKSECVATATREDLLVICDENLVNVACNETSCVIDNGASIHVTSMRDFFISYTPSDFVVLKMCNDGLVPVIGMGNVSLVSNNGTKLTLKDVRHALDIRLNLISAGKLDDEGFCKTFSEGHWKLTKGSFVVARGKKSSNLYLMHASTSRETVNVIVNDNSTELWHKLLEFKP